MRLQSRTSLLVTAACALAGTQFVNAGFWSWPGFACALAGGGALLWWILKPSANVPIALWVVLSAWLGLEIFHILKDGAHWSVPAIDVYHYHTEASQRILRGDTVNGEPYYPGNETLSRNYPYMPAELGLRLSSYAIFRDVRAVGFLALGVTYPLVLALARKTHDWTTSHLFALLAVTLGGPMFILYNAWTEPLVVPFFAAAILCINSPRWAGIFFGICAGLKLWLLVIVPAAWSFDRKTGLIAAGTAFTTWSPLALQGLSTFVNGSVLFHLRSAARPDTLALIHALPAWPTLAGALLWAALGALLALRRIEPARALVLAVAGLWGLFLLGKQGNPNYWWLLPHLLLILALFDASKGLYGARGLPSVPERATEANA